MIRVLLVDDDALVRQLDGIAATRLLRAQPSPPAVVVLTTFDADELVVRALQAGAAGFLLKDTPPGEIVGDAGARRCRPARGWPASARASATSPWRSARGAPTPRAPRGCI
jgi:DNA-binding response OmpR family regulator